MMSNSFNIAVFISGKGSNLKAIIDKQLQNNYKVVLVVSNNQNAAGLEFANQANIPTFSFNWDKKDNDLTIVQEQLNLSQSHLIVLAGFMKILPQGFINNNKNSIINIHPSLLPKYKGLHTHQRVIDNNDVFHGASVHYVNSELDAGKIISQSVISVVKGCDAKTLSAQVLFREHSLLPHTIALIGQNRVKWHANKLYFDHKELTKPIVIYD